MFRAASLPPPKGYSPADAPTVHGALVNALTVDVEDYFQVQALAGVFPISTWETCEPRVERNTERLLEIFSHAEVKATFFALGWVAKRNPALIRRIVDAGHELACHGYGHALVSSLDEAAFRRLSGQFQRAFVGGYRFRDASQAAAEISSGRVRQVIVGEFDAIEDRVDER